MLINKTVKDYVAQVASKEPTPGGGSVSALAASLGAALTVMVGNLTIGRKNYDDLDEGIKNQLDTSFEKLQEKVEVLNGIVDEDTRAFDDVMAAFKMPKESDEDKKARSQAIQAGYKKALEVPFKCAQACYEALELQEVFAHHGNINAITDVGVGTLLLASGLEGALLNVTINLQSIKDEVYRKEMEDKVADLLKKCHEIRDDLLKISYDRLG